MFHYTICNQFDTSVFKRQCLAIENHIPEIQKDKLLTDVDGSQIQSYHLKEGAVTVYNSYDIGAVYIDSEFDLTKFF